MLKSALAPFCFLSVLIGCDVEPLQMPKSPVLTPSGFETGEFFEDCMNDEDGKKMSSQETIKFEGDGFVSTYHRFDGLDCPANKKGTLFTYNHSALVEQSEADLKDWITYEYKIGKFTLVVLMGDVVSLYNSAKAYDYDNWIINESKEINGRQYGKKSTYKNPEIGVKRLSTFKREDNKVSMARYEDGEAVAENPRVFKKP